MEINQESQAQLDELIQQTKLLAETLITLRQDEAEREHKVGLIGTAMIRQRDNLQVLVESCERVHNNISGQASRTKQHNDMVEFFIEKSDERFQQLQKTHEAQQEFMASFERLHEKHQQLIDANDNNYKEYGVTLVMVVDAVNHLQAHIGDMDTFNQSETFTEDVTKLYKHIHSYVENRQAFQVYMQDIIEDLSNEINIFNQTMNEHMDDINEIKNFVESCDSQSKEIDEKFDQFVEQYNIKIHYKTDTLDKAFKQPEPSGSVTRGFFSKLFGGGKNE